MADTCTLVAKPHPLLSDSFCTEVRAGLTLLEMVGKDASHALEVRVGGEVVPRELWAKVKPKAGQYIHAQLYPQGGNGGKWLRTILLVVVAIVAIYTQQYYILQGESTWGAVAGAAISVIGSMLVTSLIPPPEMKP